MKREYYRHLPHQVPEGMPIFITWNLKGALPQSAINQFRSERDRLNREPPHHRETKHDRAIRQWKVLFAQTDQYLDQCTCGPMLLRDAPTAQIVEAAIIKGTKTHYTLLAWCVMANHVHVLLTPLMELAKVTQRLKGGTSREINLLHDQLGRTVWQDESYDHWARDHEEILRIIHYIENNPVKAGLCEKAADWRWSSARFRDKWRVGETYVG